MQRRRDLFCLQTLRLETKFSWKLIRLRSYIANHKDPLPVRMTNNGEGKWIAIWAKLKISAPRFPWKKINFWSSETQKVCPVNLFTNEWFKLEMNEWMITQTRGKCEEHSNKLFMSVRCSRYSPTLTLLGLVTYSCRSTWKETRDN